MTPKREPPRLCLVVEASPGDPGRAEAALQSVKPASVVIAPLPGLALDSAVAGTIVRIAQALGIAALIEADADLARALDADGVHLPWCKDTAGAYAAARARLGPRSIIGADAGRSRHDAMTLGELGADYVAFGIPPHVTDRETAKIRRLDLVQWWGDIFEVTAVAFDVETAQEAAELRDAGADFVAIRIPGDMSPARIERWTQEVAAALESTEAIA